MTDDIGYRLIKGRRWRISDPAIPESLRQALVDELMAARRAVGAAGRAADPEAERRARARVQDAKVALGERGPRWWLERDADDHAVRAAAAVRALLRGRGEDDGKGGVSAAEVARVIDGQHWRGRLTIVRRVLLALVAAAELARDDRVRAPFSVVRGARFPAPPPPR